MLGSINAENIISLPTKGIYESFSFIIKGHHLIVIFSDTTQGLKSKCKITSSLSSDNADLPHPETILYVQNHNPFRRKSSFLPRCADNSLYHANANPVSEVPESPPSTIKSSGNASVSDKDDDGLMDYYMLYDSAKGLLAIP